MKPSAIQVGKTYRNKGEGSTLRTVLEINPDLEVRWLSPYPRPKDTVVRYEQGGKEGRLYLQSFAAWCGGEVGSIPDDLHAENKALTDALVALVHHCERECANSGVFYSSSPRVLREPVQLLAAAGRLKIVPWFGGILCWEWKDKK
jgi:hypothetical protein